MKTLVSALAVAGLAGSAFGFSEIGPRGNFQLPDTVDRVNYLGDITSLISIDAVPLDEHDGGTRSTVEYSAIQAGAGYVSSTSTPSSPLVGFNDYQFASNGASAFGSPSLNAVHALDFMRFVGGSVTAGGKMDFFFLQNDSSTATGFTITFSAAGNFIYTFNVGAIPGGIYVPEEGYYVAQKNAGSSSQVRQFYGGSTSGSGAPTVGRQSVPGFSAGSQDFVFTSASYNGGAPTPISERFELSVPAPGASALLGLAGLVGIRRRR